MIASIMFIKIMMLVMTPALNGVDGDVADNKILATATGGDHPDDGVPAHKMTLPLSRRSFSLPWQTMAADLP